jgi:hypothetical protein
LNILAKPGREYSGLPKYQVFIWSAFDKTAGTCQNVPWLSAFLLIGGRIERQDCEAVISGDL